MLYADSHVEFIHHPDDIAKLPDPLFVSGQISVDMINVVKPELLFLAAYVDPGPDAWIRLRWVIREYKKVICKYGWILVECGQDLQKPGIKIVLHVEALYAIGQDLEKIHILFEAGVRSIGLTHNQANQFAGGCSDPKLQVTELGYRAIEKIIERGIFLDLAHLNKKCFIQVLQKYQLPAFVSHAGVYSEYANPRNLDNEQLEMIIETNGYLGISMAGSFLASGECSKADYVRQVKAAAAIVGNNRVGIGSDWGGITSRLPEYLETIAKVGGLINELPTANILGDNLISYLRNNLR